MRSYLFHDFGSDIWIRQRFRCQQPGSVGRCRVGDVLVRAVGENVHVSWSSGDVTGIREDRRLFLNFGFDRRHQTFHGPLWFIVEGESPKECKCGLRGRSDDVVVSYGCEIRTFE
jgi:hypothetical protein